jgi:hypothetical protein
MIKYYWFWSNGNFKATSILRWCTQGDRTWIIFISLLVKLFLCLIDGNQM